MNIAAELVTIGIRALTGSNNKSAPAPSTSFDVLMNMLIGPQKTPEEKLAEDIVAGVANAVQVAKKANTNRKFKKITKNY